MVPVARRKRYNWIGDFGMIIREYNTSDCSHLAKLFYETVHSVNARDYTREQINVWASGNVNLKEWDQSFLAHYTLVAIENEEIVGFGDIDPTGYLDRLYIHKDYQNQGIAAAICNKLEQRFDTDKIITHASITAKPFFEKRGYRVIQEQEVERRGILLTNYVMEK